MVWFHTQPTKWIFFRLKPHFRPPWPARLLVLGNVGQRPNHLISYLSACKVNDPLPKESLKFYPGLYGGLSGLGCSRVGVNYVSQKAARFGAFTFFHNDYYSWTEKLKDLKCHCSISLNITHVNTAATSFYKHSISLHMFFFDSCKQAVTAGVKICLWTMFSGERHHKL